MEAKPGCASAGTMVSSTTVPTGGEVPSCTTHTLAVPAEVGDGTGSGPAEKLGPETLPRILGSSGLVKTWLVQEVGSPAATNWIWWVALAKSVPETLTLPPDR